MLPSISQPVRVIVPVPFHNAPPSFAALFVRNLPVIVEFAAPVICIAPPLPGGPVAVLFRKTVFPATIKLPVD